MIRGSFGSKIHPKKCSLTGKIVALIGKVPVGSAFSFAFKSAKYHSADKIDYSVIISGFGPTPVEAQFLLCVKTGKLSGGSVPACKRTHFHGLVAQQSAKMFANPCVDDLGILCWTRPCPCD